MNRSLRFFVGVLALTNLVVLVYFVRSSQAAGGKSVAEWLIVNKPYRGAVPAVDSRAFHEQGIVIGDPNVMNQEVLKLPDGRFRMLVHTVDQRILSAISSDGKKFEFEPGVRLRGSMMATVRLDDGRYRMYYAPGIGRDFISAVSTDYYTFTPEAGTRLGRGGPNSPDCNGVIHPCVIRLPDGRWRMYYDGVSSNPQVDSERDHPIWTTLSATSPDGINFTKDPGLRVPTERFNGGGKLMAEWSCDVHVENGIFIMYVGTYGWPPSTSGIFRLVSTDGLNFAMESEPVIPVDPRYRDEEIDILHRHLPQDPSLLVTPQGERIFYWTDADGIRSVWRPRKD